MWVRWAEEDAVDLDEEGNSVPTSTGKRKKKASAEDAADPNLEGNCVPKAKGKSKKKASAEDAPDPDLEGDAVPKSKGKPKKATVKKAVKDAKVPKKAAPSHKHALPEDCLYKPHEFSEKRMKFIRKRQNKLGLSFRDANKLWVGSKTRAKLLENMPHKEKVRRRFV